MIIKKKEGKIMLEVPLTIGVVGGVALTAMTPALVAIAGLVTKCSVVVEKADERK
jgi:hypothetical protein